MRLTSALLLSGGALSAATASVDDPQATSQILECLHSRSHELSTAASCGDVGSINYCLSHATTPTTPLTSLLETCFINAGCTAAEARIEAFWTLHRCETPASDLRRRRANPLAAIPREAAALPPPLITLAARQDTTATPTPAAATTTNASPSPCFTTTDVSISSCPTQSTGSDAGKKLSCFPTTVPSSVCAAGLICHSDAQGNPSCMYRQSELGTAGIIIAIVFAVAISASICAICFLCCRESRVQKRLERAAEAAKIAKEAKASAVLNAKRGVGRGVEMHEDQPLMQQQVAHDLPPLPPMPMAGQFGGNGGGYQQGGEGGHNPFADDPRDAHPLR
ncbi:hypothetical protein B0T19DRAFT_221915 [Cercophora scortea]|uniref:Uncharacterized protein n=1 Tax=Cercophora scortea TaxID=314031 RepID=A0AAE0IFI9_9PEZI|nr:hypothetical protein B0T19DRAFT_221915 [Cercophora scortea]